MTGHNNNNNDDDVDDIDDNEDDDDRQTNQNKQKHYIQFNLLCLTVTLPCISVVTNLKRILVSLYNLHTHAHDVLNKLHFFFLIKSSLTSI